MRLGLGLGVRNSGFVGGYDSATSAFLAATGITGKTESDAVNNLVLNLKSYGLWSKMKAIYPFVSDTVNLLSYSEVFTNAVWGKDNSSTSDNQTTAPNGTTTAGKLIEAATNNQHLIYQSNTTVLSQVYTFSCYAKANERSVIAVQLADSSASTKRYTVLFDLSNGTVLTARSINSPTSTSNSISNAGNGWYRLTVTMAQGGGTTLYSHIALSNSTTPTFNPVDFPTYLGDGIKSAFVWGAQLEVSATASTYQPIATTPANRFISQFKYNLKDARDLDAAFRLAFNGTWTYSKQGAKANGTSAYANTYYNTSVNSITNSNSIGFYANIANTSALSDPSSMGNVRISDLNGSTMTASGTSMSTRLNNAPIAGTISGATGLFTATRQSATVTKLFKNATQTATGNSGGVPINETVFIANSNIAGSPYAAGYVNNQFTFAHMSDGLSDSDVSNLYTSVQAFNTSLNRQV